MNIIYVNNPVFDGKFDSGFGLLTNLFLQKI